MNISIKRFFSHKNAIGPELFFLNVIKYFPFHFLLNLVSIKLSNSVRFFASSVSVVPLLLLGQFLPPISEV
jgi:hypothetical protein